MRRVAALGLGLLACREDAVALDGEAIVDGSSSSSTGTGAIATTDEGESSGIPDASSSDDGDETHGGGGHGGTATRFVDVTRAAGLSDAVQSIARAPPFCLLDRAGHEGAGDYCVAERLTGGVAVGDYDGDGFSDLFLTALDGPGRLFRNQGDGTFVERTAVAGLGGSTRSNGAAWADVDGDGDLDLYLATFALHRHLLYVNQGDGTFVEDALARGAAIDSDALVLGTTPAFGDMDLDGDLDLFVGEWRPDAEMGDEAHHARLLENLGPGQPGFFADVTAQAGIDLAAVAPLVDAKPGVYAFAPAFVDLDDDRRPDLAIAGDFGTSRIYWNAGDGTFTDGSVAAGVDTVRNAMGSSFGDLDGDGRLDWFVTAISTAEFPELGNRLYMGAPDRVFVDATDLYGVRDGEWGWGAALFDADGDMDLDAVMTAGWTQEGFEDDRIRFWHNDGAPPLVECAAEMGLAHVGQGRGLVVLDLENDGDLDVLVVHWAAPPKLFRNEGEPPGFLRVRTVGTAGNTRGLGARVEVLATPDAARQVRVVGVGTHFLGQSDPVPHFGLGARDGAPVHEVRIVWPTSGAVQVLHDVPRNGELVVVEPPG